MCKQYLPICLASTWAEKLGPNALAISPKTLPYLTRRSTRTGAVWRYRGSGYGPIKKPGCYIGNAMINTTPVTRKISSYEHNETRKTSSYKHNQTRKISKDETRKMSTYKQHKETVSLQHNEKRKMSTDEQHNETRKPSSYEHNETRKPPSYEHNETRKPPSYGQHNETQTHSSYKTTRWHKKDS